jgi:hypothetical protein
MRRPPSWISSRSAEMVGASAPRSHQNPSGARRRWAARVRRIAHHTTANASAPMSASAANTPTIPAKITSRLMLVLLQIASAFLEPSLGCARPQPASPVPFAASSAGMSVRTPGPASARRAHVAVRDPCVWLFTCLVLGGARRSGSDSGPPRGALALPLHAQPRATCSKGTCGPTGYALAASVPASASTPRSLRTSSSAVCQAGATLFLVTCTRTRLPTTSPPTLSCPNGRRSRRTEA